MLATLTGRESEVFRLMAKGLSDAEIASTLVVSETAMCCCDIGRLVQGAVCRFGAAPGDE